MSESDLSRAIQQVLRARGCKVIRIQAGAMPIAAAKGRRFMRFAEPGTPDLLVIRHGGIYTWLEVKTAEGELSEAQRAWHKWAVRAGLRIAVVRSIQEAINATFS